MARIAVDQLSTGATTLITSYDSSKWNLGSVIKQYTGSQSTDNFIGPMKIAQAKPIEESTAFQSAFIDGFAWSSRYDWVFTLENTTAGTWTWTASGVPGIYNLTNPSYGAGTDVNRIAVFTTKDTSTPGLITASYNGVNIQFRFIGVGWGALDNIIYGSSVEIRVYPS